MKNIVAIYARLSREDENKYYGSSESRSIENQIKVLSDYASEHGYLIYKIYYDDGYSGATLERPQFQEMINDMRSHKFNTILVKDISRIGRSLHKVGNLIEKVFPENNIRVISVNDKYDSSNYNDDMSIVLRSFLNEYYLKDFRKKCRKAREHYAKTKHLNYYPKYGYNFDEERNEIIDDYSANIVRRIFDYIGNKGLSTFAVAKILNEEGVLTRSLYATQVLGLKGLNKKPATCWNADKVWAIAKDYEYCGHSINWANHVKEERIFLPNTHKALIDEDLYKRTQDVIDKRGKRQRDELHIAKLLKDKTCNGSIFYDYYANKKVPYYFCRDKKTQRRQYLIPAKLIENIIYKDAMTLLKLCKENSARVYNVYKEKLFNGAEFDENNIKQELKRLNEFYSKLLEGYFDKTISEFDFERKSKNIIKQINECEELLNSSKEKQSEITLFNIRFGKFLESIKETPKDTIELIKLVVKCVYINKKPINNKFDITIVYKFE